MKDSSPDQRMLIKPKENKYKENHTYAYLIMLPKSKEYRENLEIKEKKKYYIQCTMMRIMAGFLSEKN